MQGTVLHIWDEITMFERRRQTAMSNERVRARARDERALLICHSLIT